MIVSYLRTVRQRLEGKSVADYQPLSHQGESH